MSEPLSGEERAALDAVIERDNDWDGLGIDGAVALTLAVLAAVPRLNPLAARVAELERDNGWLRGQVAEALAVVRDGSEYDRLHVEGILSAAAPPTGGTTE